MESTTNHHVLAETFSVMRNAGIYRMHVLKGNDTATPVELSTRLRLVGVLFYEAVMGYTPSTSLHDVDMDTWREIDKYADQLAGVR